MHLLISVSFVDVENLETVSAKFGKETRTISSYFRPLHNSKTIKPTHLQFCMFNKASLKILNPKFHAKISIVLDLLGYEKCYF